MNPTRLVATVLIIAGVLGLAYGSFSYKENTTVAQVGPIQINARETHTVNVPALRGLLGRSLPGPSRFSPGDSTGSAPSRLQHHERQHSSPAPRLY